MKFLTKILTAASLALAGVTAAVVTYPDTAVAQKKGKAITKNCPDGSVVPYRQKCPAIIGSPTDPVSPPPPTPPQLPPPPVVIPDGAKALFIEGDSISICNTTNGDGSLCNLNFTYAGQYQANNDIAPEYGWATGGNGIADLEAGKAALIAAKPANTTTVVSVLIGANDLMNGTYANGQAYYNALVAYTDSLRAAGFKVVVATILPNTGTGFNARRAEVNALIKANPTKFDAIADFGSHPIMGQDSTASNTQYFQDGVHPTGEGHGLLVPVYKAAIDLVFGGAAPPAPAPNPIWVPSPSLTGLVPVADNFDVNLAFTPSWGAPADPGPVGAFRFNCQPGQLRMLDPIVNPGPQGTKSNHLHQFFGNTVVESNSTYESLRQNGGSTCNIVGDPFAPGAIAANRSAYWMPAMLDGLGNVVRPDYLSVYYKQRPNSDPKCDPAKDPTAEGICVALPHGLRFIFGYDMVSGQAPTGSFYFNCTGPTGTGAQYATFAQAAANCPTTPTRKVDWAGREYDEYNKIGLIGTAPQCWDGKNLDSPNHRDHTAYVYNTNMGYFKCPSTHPYRIPDFLFQAWYSVDPTLPTWKLDSDIKMGKAAGETFHVDFFMAWSPTAHGLWRDNCINRMLSCTGGALNENVMLRGATGAPWLTEPKKVPLSSIPDYTP